MADAYKAWLQEQVAYWNDRCLESAAERGRPTSEGVRYADERLKNILETFEECLDKFNELAASATPAPSSD